MNIVRLQKRADFVRLTHKGRKQFAPAFIFQSLSTKQDGTVRIGFTASKKIGNAVQRNRAKRRLRAVTDELIRLNPTFSTTPHDFVFVARRAVIDYPYEKLKTDIKNCLEKIKCVL